MNHRSINYKAEALTTTLSHRLIMSNRSNFLILSKSKSHIPGQKIKNNYNTHLTCKQINVIFTDFFVLYIVITVLAVLIYHTIKFIQNLQLLLI